LSSLQLNNIFQGDCVEVLKTLPSNSIDVIFADPPYNLQLNRGVNNLNRPQGEKVEGVNDQWDKFSSFQQYDDFTQSWLSECRRVLKTEGTIWVSGTYHNIFRIGKIIQDLGYWILNDVVWVKNNPMPNFLGRRFCASHETLIWAVKEQGGSYTFNYKSMKALNNDTQMRSDWRIPICQGKERLTVNGKKAHSTQKPEALLYRIILASSNPNDIILDPFFGTGTTGAVAKLLGRNYIGIEQNTDYIQFAKERISKVEPLQSSILDTNTNSKNLEIPFGTLIEKGMIKPNEFLHSLCGKKKARILPDGNIRFQRKIGSIHSIACLASGMEGMNGWKYWQVKADKKLHEIDVLREIYHLVNNENQGDTTYKNYPIYLYKLSKIGCFLSELELEKLKNIILTEYNHLNQEERRKYASRQAKMIGWGGQSFVSDFLGMSRVTIRKAKK
jgi:DNA modification methylase